MRIGDRRAIRQSAAEKLAQAKENPRKLVLLHTGAALALSTLLTVVNFILTRQIDATGGLSGLGSRAVLETARTMLQYASAVLLPFWELGFVFAAIQLARGQEAKPVTLLEGFRRFFPALRLMLLRLVLYIGIILACANFSATIFALTPFVEPMMEMLEPMINSSSPQDVQVLLEQLNPEQLLQMMWPVWVIFAVLCVLLLVPFFYRFRMAEFILMDVPKTGAFAAMAKSNRIMRRSCWKLFRLDLSFWWFYGLRVILTVICYGDLLVDKLGISLPIGKDIRFFLFYILYALCQLGLDTLVWGHVKTTYAVAYDTLLAQSGEVRKPVQEPNPWQYQ